MPCKLPPEPTMMTMLKPIILVNQWLGVCPHEISECGEILVFRWTSTKLLRTLLTMTVLLLHFSYTTFQFGKALLNGGNMVQLGFLFAWMIGPFISILIICVTIQKRQQFTDFFQCLQTFRSQVCMQGISTCKPVVRVAWRFYAFYMFLAICCAALVGLDTMEHPNSEVYVLHYFPLPSQMLVSLNCFYQVYLVIITQSACAIVEVLCASISYSIVNKIMKIQRQMKDALGQTGGCPVKEIDKEKAGLIPYYRTEPLVQLTVADDLKKPEYTPLTMEPICSEDDYTTGAGPILKAIRRFSFIAQEQRLINCIFGPILALDIAWLVIHVCLLFFLQIKSLGLASTTGTGELVVGGGTAESGSHRFGLFAGQGLIYLIRLLIVLISLGNVHESTKWFDNQVSGSLMKVKKPRLSDINMIQVHLLGNQVNPVSFSAGGFFILSRGTLLYAFSIITTYIVFLLQA